MIREEEHSAVKRGLCTKAEYEEMMNDLAQLDDDIYKER